MKTGRLTEKQKEQFAFLNERRASGRTNMFGAGAYLEDMFGLTKGEARKVLKAWMDWFPGFDGDGLT